MTDLDSRIRSYASRSAAAEDGPPDFDAAFEQAVLTPPRRTTWVWSGVAAACVVALAAFVSVAASGTRGVSAPAGAPAAGAQASSDSAKAKAKAAAEAAAKAQAEASLARARAAHASSVARAKREAEALAKARAAVGAAAAARLQEIARTEARSSDGGYASATAVLTTRQKAFSAVGSGFSGPNDAVWLIQLDGNFVEVDTGSSGSSHTVRGRYLVVVVDHSGSGKQLVEIGPRDRAVDLTALGTVVTLLP